MSSSTRPIPGPGEAQPTRPGVLLPAENSDRDRYSSRTKSVAFTRHVKELFIFLVVVVAVLNVSSIFLLQRLLQERQQEQVTHLNEVLDRLHGRWSQTSPEKRAAIDLSALARQWRVERLTLAVFFADDSGRRGWHYLSGSSQMSAHNGWDSVSQRPPRSIRSGPFPDGGYREIVTRAESWGNDAVVAAAAVWAPTVGVLSRELHREILTRGLILAAFGAFAFLFYRLVLLPFRDMRRRAAALVDSGVLPEDTDHDVDDPEYVMATFDVLVRRLVRRAEDLHQRAVSSERRARDLEQFNEYMLTSLSTGVVIISSDGTVLRLNPSAETILRTAGKDVVGRPYTGVGFYPELVAIIEEGLRDGFVYSRREVQLERQPAEYPSCLGINTSRIRDECDQVIGLSVLLTDLTEIKRLYNELAENQRLADLGEMAGGLAHQLRNSIAAILGYGKLLYRQLPPDGACRQWTEAILKETGETATMITRFLDFARPLHGEHRPINPVDVLGEAMQTVQEAASGNRVRISLASPEKNLSAKVNGDPLLLKQVFVNLMQNAIEAMPGGGELIIGIDARDSTRPKGASLRITFTDTGSGIPKEDEARVFQPFYTSRETGTGLGLPLAKKIAVAHGGNIRLEHSGPTGTTFAVLLPCTGDADDTSDHGKMPESRKQVVPYDR